MSGDKMRSAEAWAVDYMDDKIACLTDAFKACQDDGIVTITARVKALEAELERVRNLGEKHIVEKHEKSNDCFFLNERIAELEAGLGEMIDDVLWLASLGEGVDVRERVAAARALLTQGEKR